jgi:OPT family oligopeptide transporter
VAQLTALPLGKVLEWTLPATRFHTVGFSWSLNPGPFSIKEHVVITVMANVAAFNPFALDVIAVQQFFYKQSLSYSYQIMLVLSTQLIGLSLGGFLRQFVVWPANMLWPNALVRCALFTTLHKNYGMAKNGRLRREKYFCIALACSFIWYWVPGYLWTGLSIANWVCWIAPKDIVVNQLFGTISGLGMSVVTMDWTVISYYMGSPLVIPVRALPSSLHILSMLNVLSKVVDASEYDCVIHCLFLDHHTPALLYDQFAVIDSAMLISLHSRY